MSLEGLLFGEVFFRNALIAGLIASVVCGVVGPIVLVKRIGSIAGGVAHSVLGGMGVAVFAGFDPIYGAFVAALISALLIGTVAHRHKRFEEVMINALWALGMAIGIICIAKTPGYAVDLNSYLFGNILMVSENAIIQSAIAAGIVFTLVMAFYKQILALCFDAEFAYLRGVRVGMLNTLLLSVVALTVVVLLQIVGLIMVIALLSLPAATAMLFFQTLPAIMMASTAIGAVATMSGLLVAYSADLPAGATIILVSSALFVAAFAYQRVRSGSGALQK
jgi:zinc transport system permease protein